MRLLERRIFKAAVVCILCAVTIRALPLLAPMRAASLAQQGQALEFTDRNGLALGTVLSRDQEHTATVSLAAVSPLFVEAIIASEDSRYYHHGAVDYRAVVRAALQALRHHRVMSGASTLTMQLARMVRPLPGGVRGKVLQIWTAWRLEAGMTKAQILEAYVNRLPMGGNVYGVEAAARVYFGMSAARLDLARGSLLAALPNNPPGLLPYGHWHALKARQAYILKRMLVAGYIDQAQLRRALEEQILLRPRGEGILAAPHFLFWLASRLPAGTSHVRTSIDRPLQMFVETQVRQVIGGLASRNVHHAAVLVIDNHTGQVLAYAGSPDYFSDVQASRNDGVQSLRQPGSALKPFLYELALESRSIAPNTILADVPAHYAIPGGLVYSPSDYNNSFLGPVRVRVALGNSLNVPAVRVLAGLGVTSFLDRLHTLAFGHLTRSADYYGLGLTLGGGEVSLWELTRAYATLARGGQSIALSATADGRTVPAEQGLLEQPKDRVHRAPATDAEDYPNPQAAWALVTDILSDPHARAKAFGLNSVLDVPFPAAVKTGTSSDYRDTWTVGFTRDYTVGVWVGNFNGEPMRQVSGVTGAAPLWSRIIMHLHEQRDPEAFAVPHGLILEPMCATTGLRPTSGCASVVFEYLYPQDLAAYHAAPASVKLPPTYDDWLVAQHAGVMTAFKISFPHDGDVFARYPARSEFAADRQALQFQTSNAKGRVRWFLNGRRLASDANGSALWPVQPGTWRLRAVSERRSDLVVFQVIQARERVLRRGFSLAN